GPAPHSEGSAALCLASELWPASRACVCTARPASVRLVACAFPRSHRLVLRTQHVDYLERMPPAAVTRSARSRSGRSVASFLRATPVRASQRVRSAHPCTGVSGTQPQPLVHGGLGNRLPCLQTAARDRF